MDERLQRAMNALGVTFRDPSLLRVALVHKSHLNEMGVDGADAIGQSNERLEFLGDALLGLICAEFVYARFPDATEGALTSRRVALVRTETLAAWGSRFRLEELTYLARGELSATGEVRQRVLAGTFEAVLAAIYLDRGIRAARRFMRRLLDEDADELIDTSEPANYKGRLQEMIQDRERVTPGYRTVSTSGPAHDRHFVVEAVLRGQQIGTGSGASKRAAEQEAARDALERLALEGIVDTDGRAV
ncbi:MAG TPA: ribonuclease III [Thermomicrobiales bacterium]|nr:ribonuclease III [Thermomicrobiales bacterium]